MPKDRSDKISWVPYVFRLRISAAWTQELPSFLQPSECILNNDIEVMFNVIAVMEWHFDKLLVVTHIEGMVEHLCWQLTST
jgi:hypothetical protein